MHTFSESFEVVRDDLDELDHVNNIRYVQWIQDISRKHWQQLTDQQIRSDMVWVVRNHNISYLKPALLGDTLQITTFIESTKGPLSIRMIEMKNQATGQLLVRAKTQWCLLDAVTLRPKRVPESIQALFL